MPVLGQVVGSIFPSGRILTILPWHCLHPEIAAGGPSTTSPRKLSRLPRMSPASIQPTPSLAWVLYLHSSIAVAATFSFW
jgi:hypothetical protein